MKLTLIDQLIEWFTNETCLAVFSRPEAQLLQNWDSLHPQVTDVLDHCQTSKEEKHALGKQTSKQSLQAMQLSLLSLHHYYHKMHLSLSSLHHYYHKVHLSLSSLHHYYHKMHLSLSSLHHYYHTMHLSLSSLHHYYHKVHLSLSSLHHYYHKMHTFCLSLHYIITIIRCICLSLHYIITIIRCIRLSSLHHYYHMMHLSLSSLHHYYHKVHLSLSSLHHYYHKMHLSLSSLHHYYHKVHSSDSLSSSHHYYHKILFNAVVEHENTRSYSGARTQPQRFHGGISPGKDHVAALEPFGQRERSLQLRFCLLGRLCPATGPFHYVGHCPDGLWTSSQHAGHTGARTQHALWYKEPNSSPGQGCSHPSSEQVNESTAWFSFSCCAFHAVFSRTYSWTEKCSQT